MIILITGSRNIGKTTLVQKLISTSDSVGGYFTYPYNHDGLYMGYMMHDISTGNEQPISVRNDVHFVAQEHTFEGFGAELIQKAMNSDCHIIVLDEIGRFEQNCPAFKKSVTDLFECDKLILMVLKKEPIPFIEEILTMKYDALFDLDECDLDHAYNEISKLLI